MFQGLVYNLKHDRKKTEELASVGRMVHMPVMVLPEKVVDLPLPAFKQFDTTRRDRLNDLTQQQVKERQQELQQTEANNEAEDEEKKAGEKQHKEQPKASKKRKQDEVQDKAVGNPDLAPGKGEDEFQMEVEQDDVEVRETRMWARKPRVKQVVQQSYDLEDLRPKHVTKSTDRADRAREREERKALTQASSRTLLTKERAKLAGQPPEELREVCAWLHLAPRRRTMLSADLQRVWKTCDEKVLDALQRHELKKEGINVNALQAHYDVYSEEMKKEEKVFYRHHLYTEDVWGEDICEEDNPQTAEEKVKRQVPTMVNATRTMKEDSKERTRMTLSYRWGLLPKRE
jgi:hypothetical protein